MKQIPSHRLAALILFALLLCACAEKTQGRTGPYGAEQTGHAGSVGNPTNPLPKDPALQSDASDKGNGQPCDVSCSADLRDIVACDGSLIEHCSTDKGCAAGKCVEPCEAARANGSTLGCEFYSAVPASSLGTSGHCFAAMLANTWSSPIAIGVEYDGAALDLAGLARTTVGRGETLAYKPLENGQLAPGELAVLFLSSSGRDCPEGVTPGINVDPAVIRTGIGKAFRITTNAPVSAYDIYPYGGASSFISSATLLIPTSAWGTNYMPVDGYPALNRGGAIDSPFTQIVAMDDDTKVTIRPTGVIEAATDVVGTEAGQPQTYSLSKGQMLQFAQNKKLAGSAISSDKPVGVWGGASCMNIPALKCCCDSAHQQFLPIKSLGFTQVAARYRDRKAGLKETVPWLIVGAVDNTVLTYDPAPPAGAPLSLDSGQTVYFDASDVFTVKSAGTEQPFHLVGHMTAGTTLCTEPEDPANAPDLRHCGDPDFVNNVPPEQWLKSYVFLTDPTYSNSHLVVTRKKASDGSFKDVTLECAGTVTGFAPVSPNSDYEVARIDLVTRGVENGNCDNGVQAAQSEEPFGLTVWGWDTWVSYAYPAGMSVRPINTVIVRPDPK